MKNSTSSLDKLITHLQSALDISRTLKAAGKRDAEFVADQCAMILEDIDAAHKVALELGNRAVLFQDADSKLGDRSR